MKSNKKESEGMKSNNTDYPIIKLLQIYRSRIDLQKAFPEVMVGNLKRLLEWVITCGLTIDSSKDDLLPYEDFYRKKSSKKHPYIILTMDIINKCNLKCIFCGFSLNQLNKSETKYINIDDFRNLVGPILEDTKIIRLSCGAEPLASKHFKDIVNYIGQNSNLIEIEFCTNGTLMNKEISKLCIENPVTNIMVSLDGVNSDTVENIRKGASFFKILRNIQFLNYLKEIYSTEFPKLTLNYILMKRNVHEAVPFLYLAKNVGAGTVDFRFIVSPELYNLAHEDLDRKDPFVHFIFNRIKKFSSKLSFLALLPPLEKSGNEEDINNRVYRDYLKKEDSLIKQIENYKITFSDKIELDRYDYPKKFVDRNVEGIWRKFDGVLCKRPFTELLIRNLEEILPCPWYAKVLGRISKETETKMTLKDIFEGSEFANLRNKMIEKVDDEGCNSCPLRGPFASFHEVIKS